MRLGSKAPREQSGRDTFSRYRRQAKSAAISALSILDAGPVDRVYCDLHDDFIVREKSSSGFSYIFYQVKTNNKQSHNWTLSEVFGLNAKVKDETKHDLGKLASSFVGKLLLHTVVFDECCNSVVFQTNINNHDDIESIVNDIECGKFENKFNQYIIKKFNALFPDEINNDLSDAEIKSKLSKLKFETDVQYLKPGDSNFEPLARDKIYQYSEVDLSQPETKEIMLKLLALVEDKSTGIIDDINQETIEEYAGISIEDLLGVLSISRDGYAV